MNTKEQWIDKFQELLWEHHTCDWELGNKYPKHPWHLAVSYYYYSRYNNDGAPADTVESVFTKYLESLNEY